jgi:hypothetical protein
MITPPPLIDTHPGDPITSEQWNNVLEAVRRIYEAMNKNLGALAIKVVNKAGNNAIRGAIVTVKPIDSSSRFSFEGTTPAQPTSPDLNRPSRPALFVGGGEDYYQVSQLPPGFYNVIVEASGFITRGLPITMPENNPLKIDVEMTAAETLFPMPNLFGLTLTQALTEVKKQEFQVISIIDSHGKDTPATAIPEEAKGARVLGQMPDPGTLIAKNAPIQIHISAKAEYAERIKVPDLRGLTLEEAKLKLASVHLVLGETVTVRNTGQAAPPPRPIDPNLQT